jgi:7-cyano-7-deazaguanine synthase in queuosine biosynthesis
MRKYRLVICFSGGMDSYIAYKFAMKECGFKKKDILLLNFDINQPYKAKEKRAIKKLGVKVRTIKIGLLNKKFGNMPTKDSYIIQARNLIFATIAASFSDKFGLSV